MTVVYIFIYIVASISIISWPGRTTVLVPLWQIWASMAAMATASVVVYFPASSLVNYHHCLVCERMSSAFSCLIYPGQERNDIYKHTLYGRLAIYIYRGQQYIVIWQQHQQQHQQSVLLAIPAIYVSTTAVTVDSLFRIAYAFNCNKHYQTLYIFFPTVYHRFTYKCHK